ncbi:phage major capsid protein [Massilia sp. CCM 8695]|uniref:Phage major capsid protein n=1 Tax=Massilia frigida TaxID=2609281 RepID=A0ABX0NJD3_9BURK|nr:phage major capsid protein [Massilia frigida]NHZ83947.1 phage major capsid protein [Massilia frigida]
MIHQFKEQKAQAVQEMRALVEKAQAEKRNLSGDESAKFDALKSRVTDLEGQESRASFLADAERRMIGTPVDKSQADLESGISFLEVLRAGMEGRNLTGAAAEYSQETERRTGRKAGGMFIPLSLLEKRVNTTTSAGQIRPTDHRADLFIEPFRNKLLARKLGARVLTGLTGNVDVPAYGTGVTSGWVAENSALTASDMTFTKKTLSPKHVGALSEMSRQLIQQSSPDIEQLLRDDMAFALAQAIDSAMIKGGGANEPTGILSTVGIQTVSLSTLNYANVLGMLKLAEMSNSESAAWLTSPQVMAKLRGSLKAAGIAGYLSEGGQLADLPIYSTKQVPLNTTTGQVILGDFSQVMLGIWSELDILVNPFDSVAYARGGVLVRAMATCDIAIRHPEAFVVASDVVIV